MQPSPDQSRYDEIQSSPWPPTNPPVPSQTAVNNLQVKQAHEAAGASFYSIAIFSLINSVINFFQGSIYFPIGLGITQIIDGFSFAFQQELPDASTFILAFGIILNLVIFIVVALFGFFIKKQTTWLIIAGGILYLLDGLLVLFFEDWIGAGFHAYFLFRIWTSWQLIRTLTKNAVPQNRIGSF